MAMDGRSVTGGTALLDPGGAGLTLDAAIVSISGPRAENEDAASTGPRLLAVADGVGGSVGGAVASRLVVEALSAADPDDLAAGVARANTRLGDAVAADPGLAGMATTVTVVALAGPDLVVAHVGDSRAYLWRDGHLEQLTRDQTLVQSLLDAGVITAEQARAHPYRSVVLGALHGADDDLAHLVIATVPARPGDRVLICSDGLSGVVEAGMLARVLAEERRPCAAVTRLVRAALAAGTQDNVTAVVADLVLTAPAQRSGSVDTSRGHTVAA